MTPVGERNPIEYTEDKPQILTENEKLIAEITRILQDNKSFFTECKKRGGKMDEKVDTIKKRLKEIANKIGQKKLQNKIDYERCKDLIDRHVVILYNIKGAIYDILCDSLSTERNNNTINNQTNAQNNQTNTQDNQTNNKDIQLENENIQKIICFSERLSGEFNMPKYKCQTALRYIYQKVKTSTQEKKNFITLLESYNERKTIEFTSNNKEKQVQLGDNITLTLYGNSIDIECKINNQTYNLKGGKTSILEEKITIPLKQ